jgi:aldehyde:ferredoxin oxidoreductase
LSGKILGLGSKLLCEKYGHPELSMTVKGQEFAGYDSRSMKGMGLGYATSNRGACHMKHDVFAEDFDDSMPEGKAAPCKKSQDRIAAIDSSGLCVFVTSAWGLEEFAMQMDAACEGDWTAASMLEAGERIWNLERVFNMNAGFTAADDTLPPRLLNEPAPSGIRKGSLAELEKMLPEYYSIRGWTSDGIPTEKTLSRLGLE